MSIVTEKEAAKKWCPLGRAVSGVKKEGGTTVMYGGSAASNVINVGDKPGDQINLGVCIGSKCMAWRFAPGKVAEDQKSVRIGYCGAFGTVST